MPLNASPCGYGPGFKTDLMTILLLDGILKAAKKVTIGADSMLGFLVLSES